MRAALLTPLLLAPTLAQDDDPPFDVSTLELSGSGCPADSYDIDIMSMGGFIFHAFNATLDGAASVACRAEIGVEVREGYRVVLTEVGVSGDAGLDTGVVARVNTTTSWGGDDASIREEEQVLYGSAVGVDFPNPFIANPTYDDQKSACGPGTSVLSIDVEVDLEREEGEGLGIVTVQFAGLRIAPEECGGEGGEEVPVEEETPVEEPEPVEGDIPEEDEGASDEENPQDPKQEETQNTDEEGEESPAQEDAQDPVEEEGKNGEDE